MITSACHPRLGELLVAEGLLTEDELIEALIEQKSSRRPLGELLVTKGLTSRPALTRALAKQLGVELAVDGGFGTGLRTEIERRHNAERRQEIERRQNGERRRGRDRRQLADRRQEEERRQSAPQGHSENGGLPQLEDEEAEQLLLIGLAQRIELLTDIVVELSARLSDAEAQLAERRKPATTRRRATKARAKS